MKHVDQLEPYQDESGNSIVYEGEPISAGFAAKFRGKNNRLEVAKGANIKFLHVEFWGDNGLVVIGPTLERRPGIRFTFRVGHDATVTVGKNVSCTRRAYMTASEGCTLSIGDDYMIAAGVEARTDDAHAIYDVSTGKRSNPSSSVTIGDHVWLGKFSAVLSGVTIGSGSIVGFRSIVTHDVPNNCIVAGAPAKLVRRDVAWERTMVAIADVGEFDHGPEDRAEPYWNLTRDDGLPILTAGTESGGAQANEYRARRISIGRNRHRRHRLFRRTNSN